MTREELDSKKSEILSKVLEIVNERNYVDYGLDINDSPFYVFDSWSDIREFNEAVKQVVPEIESLVDYRKDNGEHTEWIDALIEVPYNWGFSDNYKICDNCRHIVDIAPSYGTVDGYWSENDSMYYCGDCVRESEGLKEEILEGLVNNPKNANVLVPEDFFIENGFEKVSEDYEHGWYGREDNPTEIYEKLAENGYDVVFNVDYAQPFATGFSVFIRKSE